MSGSDDEPKPNGPYTIHVDVPPRFYVVPGSAMLLGTAIGGVRGSREAGMRFLAENAHRPPKTVQGWYFYWKTKNYRMILGGLRGAGADGGKLGFTALGWVTIEEGMRRAGWGEVSEVGAGLGTAAVFSAMYRLPAKAAYRTGLLGLLMGATMEGMGWAQERMRAERERVGGAYDAGQRSGVDGTAR
ncbi:hypothetical protein OF83DRAFT_1052629 [Amylostereum chailletii]|nr:hypothetical protein OF83DRAFT_1052629 [Amylostereum chailletii]